MPQPLLNTIRPDVEAIVALYEDHEIQVAQHVSLAAQPNTSWHFEPTPDNLNQ
jgi:hypothetical protein